MYVLTFIHCVSVYGTQCKCCRTCKQGLLKSPQKRFGLSSVQTSSQSHQQIEALTKKKTETNERLWETWLALTTAAQTSWGNCACVCVLCACHGLTGRGGVQHPKLPSPSGLGKMNSVPPQSLSLPCLFAWGFDTHPSREITHFHIPVLFPGLFCFLKMVFVCQHIYGMGGWVCSQAERERKDWEGWNREDRK